jgi:hypothetical protein
MVLVALLASCIQHEAGIAIGAPDDGKTFTAAVNSLVRLSLSATVAWTLESTDTQLLQLLDTSVVELGGEQSRIWNFKLTRSGTVTLRAVPRCLDSSGACPDHALRFMFDVR